MATGEVQRKGVIPGLPSGTVTFLFTDIEGSTHLWERDRSAMATAVGRHVVLLRQAIESHNGALYKVIGDAIQAAFPAAPDAVAAAVDGQRALLAEDWARLEPLRVRMAVHAGEASPDSTGDYLAPALNRLSRLLAAGSGGQVLVSQAVQQLARGALPPEPSFGIWGSIVYAICSTRSEYFSSFIQTFLPIFPLSGRSRATRITSSANPRPCSAGNESSLRLATCSATKMSTW